MCTLIVAFKAWPGVQLFVAANRDERLDRESAPPELWTYRDRRFVAPRDLSAGGTWMGLNDRGLFVGITNRFGAIKDPDRSSRGALVREALAASTAGQVAAGIEGAGATAWNGFHLIAVDGSSAHLVWSDGTTLHRSILPAGLHFLTERSFDAAPSARETRLRAELQELSKLPAPDEARFRALLARHHGADEPLEAVCVHAPALGYGTRSSAILSITSERIHWSHAEGPPCSTPYVALDGLTQALRI